MKALSIILFDPEPVKVGVRPPQSSITSDRTSKSSVEVQQAVRRDLETNRFGWHAFESSGEIPYALGDRNICRILLRGSSYFVVATMNMQLMNFRIRIILY